MLQLINNWDRAWLLKINRGHSPAADSIMWFASGDASWLPLYGLMLVLLALKYRKQSWLILIMVVPLILASDQIASHLIKPLVLRLRPSHEPGLQEQLRYLHHYRGGDYGFVLSHASNVFALATYLILAVKSIPGWMAFLLLFWAAGVSYSRVYLGVHYPTDVIAAAIVGVLTGWLLAAVYQYTAHRIFHSTT